MDVIRPFLYSLPVWVPVIWDLYRIVSRKMVDNTGVFIVFVGLFGYSTIIVNQGIITFSELMINSTRWPGMLCYFTVSCAFSAGYYFNRYIWKPYKKIRLKGDQLFAWDIIIHYLVYSLAAMGYIVIVAFIWAIIQFRLLGVV